MYLHYHLPFTNCSINFIYITRSTGPNMNPCGTPMVISFFFGIYYCSTILFDICVSDTLLEAYLLYPSVHQPDLAKTAPIIIYLQQNNPACLLINVDCVIETLKTGCRKRYALPRDQKFSPGSTKYEPVIEKRIHIIIYYIIYKKRT